MDILYHPGKANVVADALSRRAVHSLSLMITQRTQLVEQVLALREHGKYRVHGGSVDGPGFWFSPGRDNSRVD